MLQVRAVRWDAVTCTAGLVSHTATATLTPTNTRTPSITASNTATPSNTASNTASPSITRSPSLSPSPASVCNVRGVVGTGTAGSTGDGGQGTAATLNLPTGLAVNGSLLYVAEEVGRRVRLVDLATGVITTYAGTGSSTGSFLGVAATSANLGSLAQLLLLPNGDLLMSTGRCVLVGVDATTQVTYALAGTGTCLTSGQAAASGVAANTTAFGGPRFTTLWGADGVFVGTNGDNRVRLVNLTTGACCPGGGGGGGFWGA
jgi:hypothetical protein